MALYWGLCQTLFIRAVLLQKGTSPLSNGYSDHSPLQSSEASALGNVKLWSWRPL